MLTAPSVLGVVIAAGDGSGNTTAPPDDPGFANVGIRGAATAIYLGDLWVMTAAHVGFGDVILQGMTFAAEPGSAERVKNVDTSDTDILLFRLQSDPGLPSLTISETTPVLGESVVMIGHGRDRETDLTEWEVVGMTWTEVPSSGDESGYKTLTSRTIRWGENVVSTSVPTIVNTGDGDVISFATEFTDGELLNEGQAVAGDSGGAVFRQNGAQWELAGMLHAVGTFDGQPANTAVFGNETFAGDLASYQVQINNIIPEPSALVLSAFAVLFLWRRQR